MLYVSTRGEAPPLSFADALLAGLARDGGLYVPESWPTLTADEIAALAGRPYAEVARKIISPFVAGAIPQPALDLMIEDAYRNFRHPATTPLVQLGPNRFVLELFHGPTLAFKDVAMQLLSRLMDHVLSARGARATIVGATSGDTGSAAIEAFRHSDAVDVFILYPHGRVSEVQRRQMTGVGAHNVHAIAVEGTFDDCQALVKGMFNHHGFRDRMALAGVNSINWARIVAQVVYYFYAATALGAPAREVSFVVPTGNFGDILAGWVAKRMGLPIHDLTIATNVNDILVRTLESGRYEVRGVQPSYSPSMDIQVSSNFERVLFEALNRDSAALRQLMASLAQSGAFTLPREAMATICGEFSAGRADEP
ncbi:MAG: threonine synthase, partial [Pseudomonadota bacterium]